MKTRTRNDYLQRIDRAVALLQAAVTQGAELPELAQLAAAAHLSPFHFHRIYRALTGETVGNTVARLRLLRALHLLNAPEQRVTETALAIGYETPQAFARAFRQAFDTTPSDMRGQSERIQTAIQSLLHPPAASSGAVSLLRVEVISVEPFELVAMRNVGDFADLDKAYQRLFDWAAGQGVLEHFTGIYGVPHDDRRDTPAEQFAFDCALAFSHPVTATGETMPLWLGGGAWAKLRHVGPFPGLDAATDALIASWLPGSGYELRDTAFFHHYLDDPEDVPEAALRVDIYMPLALA
jgi:AraC family transcriptional regulator